MIAGYRDFDADDDLAGLVDGLEQLARHLDAERYPGSAWPASVPRRRRPIGWAIVAPLAAAAVAVVVAVAAVMGVVVVHHGRAAQSPVVRAIGRGETVRRSPRPPKAVAAGESVSSPIAVPSVVLVEDAESYSFIDMTAGTPVLSFATKDSYSPACVVPVLPGPASQAAEVETCDEYQPPPVEEGRAGGAQSGP
jgi:hypothetical protein